MSTPEPAESFPESLAGNPDDDGAGLRSGAVNGERNGPAESVDPASAGSETTKSGSAPQRKIGIVVAVAALILAIDIVTKMIAASTLEGREPVRALGGLVYFQLVRNSGAAFSFATGMTWILALLAIGVVGVLIWLARRLRSTGWAIGLGLILAGALGNLVDRVFRAPGFLRGHVVDFISLFAPNGRGWAVFNIADSAICVGAVLIVLLTLLGKEYDGSDKRSKASKTTTFAADDDSSPADNDLPSKPSSTTEDPR